MQKHEQFLEVFRTQLRSIREEKGITVYRLAQESGLAPQTISAYEEGTRTPGLEYLYKLAKGLSLKPSELLEKIGY